MTTGPAVNPWLGLGAAVVALLAMLWALRVLRARVDWHPEVLRKLAHVGIGLVSLSFPWAFDSPWPVFALSGLAVLTLLALRFVPRLRAGVGVAVHGVQRSSAGDLYFPLAAAGLFALARGNWVLYTIPILTLTLADAVAALIGVFYGRVRFEGGDGLKSVEGSVAFFVVSFLAAHVPLLLFTNTGRAESLLIGITFGVLMMLLEAIAWRGLDNLFIPFGGFLLLRAFLRLDAPALLARCIVALSLLVFVLSMRRRKTLSDSGLLAAILVGYIAWSAGGWTWLVPPLALFAAYTRLFPRRSQQRDRPHDLTSVLSVASTGVLWMLAWVSNPRPEFYYAYTLSYAATLGFIGISWYRTYRRHGSDLTAALASGLAAWLVVLGPYVLVVGPSRASFVRAALALAPLLAGAVLFTRVVPHVANRPNQDFPWARQAALTLGASALGVALIAALRMPT